MPRKCNTCLFLRSSFVNLNRCKTCFFYPQSRATPDMENNSLGILPSLQNSYYLDVLLGVSLLIDRMFFFSFFHFMWATHSYRVWVKSCRREERQCYLLDRTGPYTYLRSDGHSSKSGKTKQKLFLQITDWNYTEYMVLLAILSTRNSVKDNELKLRACIFVLMFGVQIDSSQLLICFN